jgi:hypothetical protein
MLRTNGPAAAGEIPPELARAMRQLRTFASDAAMYRYTAGWPLIGPVVVLLRAANDMKIA